MNILFNYIIPLPSIQLFDFYSILFLYPVDSTYTPKKNPKQVSNKWESLSKTGHEKVTKKARKNPFSEVEQNPLESRYMVKLTKIPQSLAVIACL